MMLEALSAMPLTARQMCAHAEKRVVHFWA